MSPERKLCLFRCLCLACFQYWTERRAYWDGIRLRGVFDDWGTAGRYAMDVATGGLTLFFRGDYGVEMRRVQRTAWKQEGPPPAFFYASVRERGDRATGATNEGIALNYADTSRIHHYGQ